MLQDTDPVLLQEPVSPLLGKHNSQYDDILDILDEELTRDLLESVEYFPLQKRESFLDQTITIFDWDDTLLPTSSLASLGLRVYDDVETPEAIKYFLDELQDNVVKVLEESLRYGIVQIITNAEEGWIQLSGRKYFPRVLDFIITNNIQLVSARTTFEAAYPNSPTHWKIQAFASQVELAFPKKNELNILCLGDSLSERYAAHALTQSKSNPRIKTVKFIEHPTFEQLSRQMSLVHSSFNDLCHHDGSFDVNLVC